jgi:dephospho-CoA kinase
VPIIPINPITPTPITPKVIGLTGGIASGKSSVAAIFARLGAAVIDADAIAREVLRSPEIAEKLRKSWGHETFRDGRPDRARIAQIAFGDPAKLKELTGWVHPPTLREMRAQLDRALADRGVPLIIIDAPLLIEADLAPWCNALIFVDVADPLRLARARADRGWSDDEVLRREAAQASLAEKRARASIVLDNNGSMEDTRAAVARLFRQWVSDPSSTAASCRAQDPARSGCPSGGERNG